jgi:adrenodoxin-NADP+ reductase
MHLISDDRHINLIVRCCSDQKEDPSKMQILLHFLKGPSEFLPSETDLSSVGSVKVELNTLSGDAGAQIATGTGNFETLPCGIAFRSIGYKSRPIPGIPFDMKRGVVPNLQGRVIEGQQSQIGLYVVGWLKRGPSGIVGTNKVCAEETVGAIASDVGSGALPSQHESSNIEGLFKERGIRFVDFEAWKRLDRTEVVAGQTSGKSREKVTSIDQMVNIALKS